MIDRSFQEKIFQSLVFGPGSKFIDLDCAFHSIGVVLSLGLIFEASLGQGMNEKWLRVGK